MARERDLKHARWYYARLLELAGMAEGQKTTTSPAQLDAAQVVVQLCKLLSEEEVDLLEGVHST